MKELIKITKTKKQNIKVYKNKNQTKKYFQHFKKHIFTNNINSIFKPKINLHSYA